MNRERSEYAGFARVAMAIGPVWVLIGIATIFGACAVWATHIERAVEMMGRIGGGQ